MTEILTESFCERCGTRYTFESDRPRARLKGVRVLSRGLKNFVLSDGSSIDEAMAAARSEADRDSTAHQLDAFHKTFSFCMSCRQYACANCWNEPESRCLSCAPLALPLGQPEFGDLGPLRVGVLLGQPDADNGIAEHEHVLTPAQGWSGNGAIAPTEDEARLVAEIEPIAEPILTAEPVASTEPVEPIAAAEPVTGAEPLETRAVVTDRVGKATAQTAGLFSRFRPGQSLDAELAAFEHRRSEPGAIAEPGAIEPPGELAAFPADAAPAETAALPQPSVDAIDVVPQPTWRITAPDPTGIPTLPSQQDGRATVQASPIVPTERTSGVPQWPARPQWPRSAPAAGLPFLGRPANPEGGIEALWAASNEELATARPAPGRNPAGIQPCLSCGLSLSATARFCRRCGSSQG
jgi:hypothetical protein